jgi:hypothetical protein
MNTIQLNIGLNISTGGQHTRTRAMVALAQHGLFAVRSRVAQSATEPTLCCECEYEHAEHGIHSSILNLAHTLQQEAIAWVGFDGVGHLTGPQAHLWGHIRPRAIPARCGTA